MYISSSASSLVLACICLLVAAGSNEARKHHHSKSLGKCQDRECELSAQHFALYSTVKRALESEFNLSGKEIVPMLRSVEIMRKRFDNQQQVNGTDLVQALLNNRTLLDALRVFNSDEGRELVTFYRASVNGRGQNLACSQTRVEDLKRVTAQVESSWEFRQVFAKINKNYLKKSAKKCLKHSCTSVDLAMTKLDSILASGGASKAGRAGKSATSGPINPDDNSIQLDNSLAPTTTTIAPTDQAQDGSQHQQDNKQQREFKAEELELCKFFKRTNETECRISGTELGNLLLEPAGGETTNGKLEKSSLAEELKFYAEHNMPAPASAEQAAGRMLAQCRSMAPLLEYNLSPLKWYRERNLIDDQKLASRAFWCKGLSYWIQIDRLCAELDSRLGSSMPNNQMTPAPTEVATATPTTTTKAGNSSN